VLPSRPAVASVLLVLVVGGFALASIQRLFAGTTSAPPVRLEVVGQIGGTAYDVVVDGDVAYLLDGPRVVAVDLSDPAAPRRVATWRASPADTMPDYSLFQVDGLWPTDSAVYASFRDEFDSKPTVALHPPTP
jgi:hypothetical protein